MAALWLAAPSAPAVAEVPNGNINLLVGNRKLVDSGWTGRGDSQNYTLGIDFDYTSPGWSMSLYAGLAGYRDNSAAVNLETNLDVKEIFIGPRIYLGQPGGFIRPYLGGGVDLMNVSLDSTVDLNVTKDSATNTAYFLNAGVVFNFLGFINVGLDARWIGGTGAHNRVSVMDYYQGSFVVGFSL